MPQKKKKPMNSEQVEQVLALMQDAPVPDLPEDFQQKLHLKLVQAAEEKEDSSLGWVARIKEMHGWRTAVPALLCLVLVIGVFSSGLYDRWQGAETTLWQGTAPSTEIAEPIDETPAPVPAQEERGEQNAKTSYAPQETATASLEVAAAEDLAEPTEETTMPAMYTRNRVADYRLTVYQPVTAYLEVCNAATQTDWTEKASTLTETYAILHLSKTEWETLSAYIKTTELQPEALSEDTDKETIVVEIDGCEG